MMKKGEGTGATGQGEEQGPHSVVKHMLCMQKKMVLSLAFPIKDCQKAIT